MWLIALEIGSFVVKCQISADLRNCEDGGAAVSDMGSTEPEGNSTGPKSLIRNF
jgi:hypothetical protein